MYSESDWEHYKGEECVPMEHGFSLFLKPKCQYSMRRFMYRTSEKKELDVLAQCDFDRFICLDIGANIGYWSCFLATKMKDGEIHAFEPDPTLAKILDKNLKRFNVRFNVLIKAVSRTNDEKKLYSNGSDTGLSSLYNFFGVEGLSCNTITIDTYVKQNCIDPVNFIKVDVQGAELDVLEGAQETINKYQPIIFIEWEDGFEIDSSRVDYPWDHKKRSETILELLKDSDGPYVFTKKGIEAIDRTSVLAFSGNLLFNPPNEWKKIILN